MLSTEFEYWRVAGPVPPSPAPSDAQRLGLPSCPMVAPFFCVVGKTVRECVTPKDEFEGLPVIDVPESEEITVAVKPDDLAEGDMNDPERHPIAIALRRRKGINDARASKREVLIRRGDQWFRYGAPKRVS
jgi:hypothetical protein